MQISVCLSGEAWVWVWYSGIFYLDNIYILNDVQHTCNHWKHVLELAVLFMVSLLFNIFTCCPFTYQTNFKCMCLPVRCPIPIVCILLAMHLPFYNKFLCNMVLVAWFTHSVAVTRRSWVCFNIFFAVVSVYQCLWFVSFFISLQQWGFRFILSFSPCFCTLHSSIGLENKNMTAHAVTYTRTQIHLEGGEVSPI